MKSVSWTKLFNVLNFNLILSLFIVFVLQFIFEDKLLHHSEFLPIYQISVILALFIFVPVLVGVYSLTFILKKRPRSFVWFLATISLVLANIVLYFYEKNFEVIGSLKVLLAFEFLFFSLFLFLLSRKKIENYLIESLRNYQRLTLILGPSALALFFFFLIQSHGEKNASDRKLAKEPKHLIMIVLDRFSAKYVSAYNDDAKVSGIDRLLESGKAKVFKNTLTNAIWTCGFFGAYYTGKKTSSFYAGKPEDLKNNLLTKLQKKGVTTRWVTFHNCGVPEGNRITNYKGFRSVFLSEKLTWIPELLGLKNYFVFTSKRSGKGIQPRPREQRLFEYLHKMGPKKDLFADHLFEQIKLIRKFKSDSYLSFHIDFNLERPEFYEEITKGMDWSHLPSDQQWDQRIKYKTEDFRLQAQRAGDEIEKLVSKLEKDGLLKNTLILVTGDHGFAYGKNKWGYQIHPDEEVVRTPLLAIAESGSGDLASLAGENRLVETTDLTQTVLNYFDVQSTPPNNSLSLFSKKEKDFVATSTYADLKNKNWFMSIYRGDHRYICNIHREGSAECAKYRPERFVLRKLPLSHSEVFDEVKADLKDAFLQYQLDSGSVHSTFKSLAR